MITHYASDWHLFSKHSNTNKILDFLSVPCDRLFLVGDIIDGYKFRKNKALVDRNNLLIIRKILKLSEKIPVIYIIGNHDDFLRETKLKLDPLIITDEYIDDKDLIIHGDKFDKSIEKFGKVGDKIYDIIDDMGRKVGVNFKEYIKKYSKSIIKHLLNYEVLLINYAAEKSCYNVIAGHTHCPVINKYGQMTYYNTGRWIKDELCTYLQNQDGVYSLVKFY